MNIVTGDIVTCLYAALEDMGQRKTNPVLDILNGEAPVAAHKYPPGNLAFGSKDWRMFYHSHTSPGHDENEHGHFHLFAPTVKTQEKVGWTHVVALSMDGMGQPIHWFTVNRWVTDGLWVPADKMASILSGQKPRAEQNALQWWMASMVALYQDDLRDLMVKRDEQLTGVKEERPGSDILENRDVYLLSEKSIDLKQKLQSCLETQTDGI